MVIQHNNYEQYITDYLDGNLSNELSKSMDAFFEQHPNLLDEATHIQEFKLQKTVFQLKEPLKKRLLKEDNKTFYIFSFWKIEIAASLLLLFIFTSRYLLNKSVGDANQASVNQNIEVVDTNQEPQPKIVSIEKQSTIQGEDLKLKSNTLPKSFETKKQLPKKSTTIKKKSESKSLNIAYKSKTIYEAKKETIKKQEAKKLSQKRTIAIPTKNVQITLKKPEKLKVINYHKILTAQIESTQILSIQDIDKKIKIKKQNSEITTTAERILAKNDSIKSLHKSSLHGLFAKTETTQENELNNRKFVRKTGKLLKSVLNIEAVSPQDVKQAFIPKSIKIKKNN